MARKIITGDKELEATLKKLADKSADKVAKAALGGSLSAVAKGIRVAAPVGETKQLKDSISSRFTPARGKKRIVTAKAGVNVGKRTEARKAKLTERYGNRLMAPHAHLVGLGTKRRFRKRMGGLFSSDESTPRSRMSTGMMPADEFVRRGYMAAKAKVAEASRKRATKALAREVARYAAGSKAKG